MDSQNKFSFEPVALSDIVKEIKDINLNKSSTKDHINYCPVSVLHNGSKLFEKIMQKQINGFISNCLSPFTCGYRKG